MRFIIGASILSLGIATHCQVGDVESSPDGSIKYIPSRCTYLHVDGDVDELEKFISAVEMHPSLTELSLARDPRRAKHAGGVSADDIETLFELLPNTNINKLSLAFNRIGDEGMELISQAVANTRLESLDLENTAINALGTQTLAEVLKQDLSDLSTINLSQNNLGGSGDALLAAVKLNSKLSSIGTEGTVLGRPENEVGSSIQSLLKGECAMSSWGEWPTCDGSCGSKQTITRTRAFLHEPHQRHGKTNCRRENTEQSKPCKVRCRVDKAPAPQKQESKETKSSSWSSFFGVTEPDEVFKPPAKVEKPVEKPAKVEKPVVAEPTKAEEPVTEPTKVEEPVTEPTKAEEPTEPTKVEEPVVAEPAKAEEPVVAEPTQVEESDYKTRLTNFYIKYNPDKVDSADMMLDRFKGREEVLFKSLVTKYGPEP